MNKFTTKTKAIMHTAVGAALLSAPMSSFATATATACQGTTAAGTGLTTGQNMGTCVKGVFQQILTIGNVTALGGLMTFVGMAIVLWKIVEIIFKGEPAKDKLGMLIGGLVIAILGTKLITLLTVMGFAPTA